LINVISGTATSDHGRKLENLVFLHLRRQHPAGNLYYFSEKSECDFVVLKNGTAELVQVCHELTPDNLKREMTGLLDAMRFFDQRKATIVTFGETDLIEENGFTVEVVPAYEYLCRG
jgi:predicted AAA+ superfamily ATPase